MLFLTLARYFKLHFLALNFSFRSWGKNDTCETSVTLYPEIRLTMCIWNLSGFIDVYPWCLSEIPHPETFKFPQSGSKSRWKSSEEVCIQDGIISILFNCIIYLQYIIILFMCRVNSSGPSIDPCGTPSLTTWGLDLKPSASVWTIKEH